VRRRTVVIDIEFGSPKPQVSRCLVLVVVSSSASSDMRCHRIGMPSDSSIALPQKGLIMAAM